MVTRFLHGFQIFETFKSVRPKNHSCEIRLKLAQWLRRKCFLKKLLMDGQRRRTVSDHSSSPRDFQSGEVKQES